MKVALFVNCKNIKNVNLRDIEKGNPGIGGTDFLFFSLGYFLTKYYCSKIEVIFYLTEKVTLKDVQKYRIVDNELAAVKAAAEDQIDIFVFRPSENDDLVAEELEQYNIKGIAWIHNEFFPFQRKALTSSKSIKRIVCVGNEQLDMYRDHEAFYKSTVIYNAINTDRLPDYTTIIKKKNIVAYTGALIDLKGFHVLAQVWKKILDKVPDAELWVLGTGQLYNSNAKLGEWGVADENYEKKWRSYLSDINGNKLKSVKFLGKIGNEKFELYKDVKVGVVNPTGKTETFCLCGIEYGVCGIPVVTAKKNGLLDTIVNNKTGILVKNKRQLVRCIVRLLNDDKLNIELGKNAGKFIIRDFDWKNVIIKWMEVFEDVKNEIPAKTTEIKGHWFSNFKFLKEINRNIKRLKLFNRLPSLLELRIGITYPYRVLKHLKK